jgi:hypothetical protein
MPFTLVRHMASKASSSKSSSVPGTRMPALETRMSMAPRRLEISATMWSTATRSATSAPTAKARPPASSMRFTTSSAESLSLL